MEVKMKQKISKLYDLEFEILRHDEKTGKFNMDFDVALKDSGKPAFRIYRWKPWAVSLGANQKKEQIDEEKCRKMGFDIVRRPTGGRAVLHANELTYSVVMPLQDGVTIQDAYRDIHMILKDSFIELGCELDFEKSQADFREFYKSSSMSVSCFASSARYEIAKAGRKIVGSAQRLFGQTLLQHGSVLLGKGHELLADVSTTNSPEQQAKLKDFIIRHSSTLSEAAGREISFEECSDAIMKTIKKNN